MKSAPTIEMWGFLGELSFQSPVLRHFLTAADRNLMVFVKAIFSSGLHEAAQQLL
jgi:hypothetical protein